MKESYQSKPRRVEYAQAKRAGNCKINKMAARCTNTSLAAKLMLLIDEEEYIHIIPQFEEDDYLNKNEVSSLKKMTAGKLWVDNRKFVTRQNFPIASGLFELLGSSVSKSANDTKSEACDFILDPDNKDVRSILRDNLKLGSVPYSKWLTKLSSDHPPSDAATLYLLCRTYKRHTVVLTSSKIWSTFKAGNRTPLDMFVKADFVLLWLEDHKFAEIKPLKTVTSTLGPLVEWQQLTDSIHHVHEKCLMEKKVRKPRQPKKPTSPTVSTPRKERKWQSKVNIDYRSMHKEGLTSCSPKQQKILPKASGPSESRLESQRMITRELLQKQTKAKGYDSKARLVGTYVKTENKDVKPKVETKPSLVDVKLEQSVSRQEKQKLVKIEASDIHMVHHTNPTDSENTWNYIHPSGSPCGRRHKLRGNLRSDELPDLTPPETTDVEQIDSSSMIPPSLLHYNAQESMPMGTNKATIENVRTPRTSDRIQSVSDNEPKTAKTPPTKNRPTHVGTSRTPV